MGGLSKKSFLVRGLMRDTNYPGLIINSGNMLLGKNHTVSRQKSAIITAQTVVQASRAMGSTFLGLGAQDLRAGLPLLQPLHQPPGFSLVSANLVHPEDNTPLFSPYTIQNVNSLRVALIGLVDHEAAVDEKHLTLLPWQKVLPQLLSQVEGKADILVLLSNYSMSENQAIAHAFPSIDCIFQAGHVTGNKTPVIIGNTLLTQTDIRGKYIGVLDIDWKGHGPWQRAENSTDQEQINVYASRFIAIKSTMRDDPLVDNIVKQAKRKIAKLQ